MMSHTEKKVLAERVREAHRKHRARRSEPPSHAEMLRTIEDGLRAAEAAREAREFWRRRGSRNSFERTQNLTHYYHVLLEVERPIKRERNRAARDAAWMRRYGRRLQEVSEAVQRERRSLYKMLPHEED